MFRPPDLLFFYQFILKVVFQIMKKKLVLFYICIFISLNSLWCQESLKSIQEDFYDFLCLSGKTESPSINYRTLSDNEWIYSENDLGLWKDNNLGNKVSVYSFDFSKNWFTKFLDDDVCYKIYGPEWFNGYNTASPYGQNDGGLWQGKGYNTALTFGFRFEALGFEGTFKPQISFSQNLSFDYIKPNYSGSTYEGKAELYGYYGLRNLDAPQRFGENSFWIFDWGDSEIRWSWGSFTVGFGTQSIWLGSAELNPIIHSNNAGSYPKLDIGMRKQKLSINGINFGDLECRLWWGKLSESDYFDNIADNNENLISGLAIAYNVPFLPGLSLAINRTMLTKWSAYGFFDIFRMFDFGMNHSMGVDEADQRASVVIDWKFQKVGLDLYVEWAKNDYSPDYEFIIRYPFHQAGYTIGMRKTIFTGKKTAGELVVEITKLECSRDYDLIFGGGGATFYSHGIITQGYTNFGQWLGAGIGTGGNSQFLGFKLYFPKGFAQLFVQRRNPDLDYTFYIDSKNDLQSDDGHWVVEESIRAMLSFGLNASYFVTKDFLVSGGLVFTDEHNPLNKSTEDHHSAKRYNFSFTTSMKYIF